MVVKGVAVLLAVVVMGAQSGAGGRSCGGCNPGGGCDGIVSFSLEPRKRGGRSAARETCTQAPLDFCLTDDSARQDAHPMDVNARKGI